MISAHVLRKLHKGKPGEVATLRLQFHATIGTRGRLAAVVAFGRALGLDVRQYDDGGWFVRRGWLVVEGEARDVLRWALAFNRAADE